MVDTKDYGNNGFISPPHSSLTELEMLRLQQVKRELAQRGPLDQGRLRFARWLAEHQRVGEWP